MEKIAQNGLIIGKFMPLTQGHCYLIEQAQQQVERLTVCVCSLAREPLDGHLRYQWVRETFPHLNVIHLTDELPSYPHEHEDFWQLWRTSILNVAPAVDVVFTSEDYGDRLAAELGARHVLVDRERSVVPISATEVRASPLQHWAYLPACVRPFYVKRVLIFGPESTGKSTLARQLAEHYQTEFVPEYARSYLEAKDNVCVYDDITRIAAGQLEAEEAAAQLSNKILFCDTDLMTTTIYSHHYFGQCPHFVQRLANERRYDLYLLMDIDLPWEADPQRDLSHRREEFRDRFRQELTSRRIPYVDIKGVGRQRLQSAIRAVDDFIQRT